VPASLVVLALAAGPADSAAITWSAPEGCPNEQVLRGQIARSLTGLPIDPGVRVQAAVVITREHDARYRLDLALDLGEGPSERTLRADTCAAAVDTAAWLIAIALDVRALDPAQPPAVAIPEPPPEAPEDPPAPEPPAASPPIAAPLPELAPQPAPAARRALHLDLWAGGGVGAGILPRVSPVAGGGITLSGRSWQVELGGQFWPRQRAEFGNQIGGRFTHGHASLRGCGAWGSALVRVPLCAGFAAGGITGEGAGALRARTARSPYLALLVGAQLWLTLHARVRLILAAEAVFGLLRPGFTLEPERTLLFRPPPVGFSSLVALALRLR